MRRCLRRVDGDRLPMLCLLSGRLSLLFERLLLSLRSLIVPLNLLLSV